MVLVKNTPRFAESDDWSKKKPSYPNTFCIRLNQKLAEAKLIFNRPSSPAYFYCLSRRGWHHLPDRLLPRKHVSLMLNHSCFHKAVENLINSYKYIDAWKYEIYLVDWTGYLTRWLLEIEYLYFCTFHVINILHI